VPAPGPLAPREPSVTTVHGVEIVDDFAWMVAPNWREVMRNPRKLPRRIRAHLSAENAHSKAWFAPLRGLRTQLFREMRGRIEQDESTVPAPDGPWAYFTRYREGGEHPLICRRPRDATDDAADQVMLDGDALAAGKAFFQLGGAAHAPGHDLLAWSADEKGSELNLIRLRDLATGADLPDAVPDTTGAAVFDATGASLFYVRLDEEHRPRRVFRHVIGTDAASDALVYEEADPGFFVAIARSASGRFLVIEAHDHETSEARLLDLATPDAAPRLVAARRVGVQYEVEHHGDGLFVLTNANGDEDFRIDACSLANTDPAAWRPLVAHRPGVFIVSQTVTGRFHVRLERENALPRIVVREIATGEEHAVAFAEEAYSLGMRPGFEFDTTTLRFTYSSPTTPTETWDYDMATRARVLRKRQRVPSGHDPSGYVARRLLARSHDGAEVPVTLLMKAGTPLDGSAPLYLYGYGSYGHALPASFRTSPLSLVDRGVIFAVAHVRGGSEKGRRWYKDGKLGKKTNTFHDFVAAAEHLIAAGYTARGRIVAHGGSAGGLLVGAVANMRPDLFAGIVGEVPFVDVLATMLDGSLPLTPPEWPEWGNPRESRDAFETIRAYSPIDNVRPRPYPAMLVTGGLTDPRVTYWEPAKWAARLREATTSGQPVLLHMNMAAGHGGAAGRFESLKETAMIFAFVLAVTGSVN
jgi:oligopeptidase B